MTIDTIQARCPELEAHANASLALHTTFRVGGPAIVMTFPKSEEELAAVLRACSEAGERPLILGNGSNVLAPDQGLNRTVICTKNMNDISANGTCLTAEAGCTMAKLASYALTCGLTGLEFAHGIPGTIGGGTVMNAGAYGGELKDVITSVRALTPQGDAVELPASELDLGYRHSCFEHNDYVITAVTVQLQPGDPQVIKQRMDELLGKRRNSQPLEYPSAGSTFKRPEGHYAAKLIEDCGLKGRTVGGAQVSPKHAGFVINTGNATANDVLALIHQVQEEVLQQTGVQLEPEVRLL